MAVETGDAGGASFAPFAPYDGVLMLRLDTQTPTGDRTYYVTPFVTDGNRMFVFDEPGDRSDALEELLIGNRTTISSASTGELSISAVGRYPTSDEEAWARDACSARFFYDQALQDLAQLGGLVTLTPEI
ncbi:hypothetical protein [Candidatus Poriferisodalis sp.]|uniref:hypothetical protein n=1 Tax=Candidatus Poriferisodalis sp. TaxID=3101277 RepID=UPI003B01E2D1